MRGRDKQQEEDWVNQLVNEAGAVLAHDNQQIADQMEKGVPPEEVKRNPNRQIWSLQLLMGITAIRLGALEDLIQLSEQGPRPGQRRLIV